MLTKKLTSQDRSERLLRMYYTNWFNNGKRNGKGAVINYMKVSIVWVWDRFIMADMESGMNQG